MKMQALLSKPLVSALAAVALTATALPSAVAAEVGGSDGAFNEMVLEMAGRDTGSLWFDYYVETVNEQIAAKDGEGAYGAAGPEGPLVGFDGYVAGFMQPDTGSVWFDNYLDGLHRVLKAKGYPGYE